MTQGRSRRFGWGIYLVLGLASVFLIAPPSARAFQVELPICGVTLPPNHIFCQWECEADPTLWFCPMPTPVPTPTPTPVPTPPPPADPVVLFIPGLQGSRLYTSGITAENKLWEPNRNADVEKLFMNEAGESISANVYTRDVIDAASGYNIYKNFLEFLDELVEDGTIAAWQDAPYDWRYDVYHHVPAMTEALEDLLAESPNSPVTIVAHSNGGLIAKALLQELAEQKAAGDNDLIDSVHRLILVATPQLGTPKAIASFLHGYDLDYVKGLVLSKATARRLAEYMPSAFNLLPSVEYFNRVEDPVIEFDSSVNGFLPFTTWFGPTIDSSSELQQFLTGRNNSWPKPVAADVISPNILQTSFLNKADETRANLESWSAPEHIDVVQIAGWGLDTVKGIKYVAKRSSACNSTVSTFCRNGVLLDARPVFTVDGDETVVAPSAVAVEGDKYFVNLQDYNQELLGGRRNRKHSDLFEANPLQELLKNILDSNSALPLHISLEQPLDEDGSKRLRVSVHSPVSLSIVDEEGNRTGLVPDPDSSSDLMLVKEDIPNSYYLEFGEGKYVGFDADESHKITLKGMGLGTFDLSIEEVVGETTQAVLNYEDVPIMPDTVAEMSLETVNNATPLKIDMDGNGAFETTIQAGQQLTPSQLIDSLSVMVSSLNLNKGDQTSTQNHLRNAQKTINDKKNKNLQSVSSQLKNVEKTITKESGKSITQAEAAAVLEVVSILRVRLGI